MNIISLMGRLTRDPEQRSTANGIPVTVFTLAVDRDRANKETGARETDFIDCVAWQSTAEFAAKHLRKGSRIGLVGSLRVRKWTDGAGNKRKTAEVAAKHIYFADSRGAIATTDAAKQTEAPAYGYDEPPEMPEDYPF